MLMKLFFIFTNILASEPTDQKANPETLSVLTQEVKSLRSHALSMITEDVNLVFKNGEIFKISYSKLKEYEIFKNPEDPHFFHPEKNCYFLSKFYLGAFKTFLSLFNNTDDLEKLIMFTNYENLDHIIELAVLLQPNPLSKMIIKVIIARNEQSLYLSPEIIKKVGLKKENIENSLRSVISSKFYHEYIARFFSICPKLMETFLKKISLSFNGGCLSACSNFIIKYSMFKGVVFIFSDEFWLKVKVWDLEQITSDPVQYRNEIMITVISKITEKKDFSQLKDQINFIQSLYKTKLGSDFKIELILSYGVGQRISKEFLRFLKSNFNFTGVCCEAMWKRFKNPVNIDILLDSMKPILLGIKFEESSTKKTCDKQIEFISICPTSIVNRVM